MCGPGVPRRLRGRIGAQDRGLSGGFCKDWWNVFDFCVVAISFVPDCGMFSALRIFRVLRVFKVISGERQMRVILDAIFRAIPGIDWAAGVMALICARK